MRPCDASKLRRLVKEYANAAVNNSWRGTCPTEEAARAALNFEQAERVLEQFIRQLEGEHV